MKRSIFLSIFPIVAILSVGCSSTPEAKAPTAPPPAPTSSPAPSGTTCIGDQCGGSAAPQPVPSGTSTAVAPPPAAPKPAFVAEIEGVPTAVTNGMTLSVEFPRMTPLFNSAAKADCSNVKVDGLIAKPGPICVVWADTVALGLKKGDSKSVRWGVDSSEVSFTLAVK